MHSASKHTFKSIITSRKVEMQTYIGQNVGFSLSIKSQIIKEGLMNMDISCLMKIDILSAVGVDKRKRE